MECVTIEQEEKCVVMCEELFETPEHILAVEYNYRISIHER